VFRQNLGNVAYPTVKDYAEKLLGFLESHNKLFPGDRAEYFVRDHVAMILVLMLQTMQQRKRQRIKCDPGEKPDAEDVSVITDRYASFWKKAPYIRREVLGRNQAKKKACNRRTDL
jgi:hypothetical protein